MALPDSFKALKLVDFNVGAAAAVAVLNPLALQVEALLTAGLGSYQADVLARLNAALAAQARLSLSLTMSPEEILARLKASILAMAQLQAALALALDLPVPGIRLSANAAILAALKVELGGIQALIKAALEVKIPAMALGARLGAALGAGPFYVLSFSETPLAAAGSYIGAKAVAGFSAAEAGLSDPSQDILPEAEVFGVLVVCKNPQLAAAFGAIISVP